jgi:1,2-phenylacetyl-CoA epoxidase PaaB subunit
VQVVGWLHHNCHMQVEVGYILRMWGVYKVQLQEVGSLPHKRHLWVEAVDCKVHKVGKLHHNCRMRVEVGYILRMWGVYKVQVVGGLPHNRQMWVEDHKVEAFHKVYVHNRHKWADILHKVEVL